MEALIIFVIAVGMFAVISAMLSLPVYFLWNLVIPEIFNLPEITWIQAWALMALMYMLLPSIKIVKK